MIRRPPRSTLSSSSAASDVYKRQPRDDVAAALEGAVRLLDAAPVDAGDVAPHGLDVAEDPRGVELAHALVDAGRRDLQDLAGLLLRDGVGELPLQPVGCGEGRGAHDRACR